MSAVIHTLNADAAREQAIERAYQQMLASTTPEMQRSWCAVMCALVRVRSPAQVRRMEVERGLA